MDKSMYSTKPVKISLTGDIGSGKSTLKRAIIKLCEANGYSVRDIDQHTFEVILLTAKVYL